jgi:hypothetical protein
VNASDAGQQTPAALGPDPLSRKSGRAHRSLPVTPIELAGRGGRAA